MRSYLLLGSLLVAALAGCLDGAPDVDDADDGIGPAPRHWVLDGARGLVDEEAFGGELPLFDLVHVTERISGEPTVGVTRTGAVFYASIDFDVAETLPSTVFYRSTDNGSTWQDKSPNVAGVRTHPESGDPYVYVDPTTSRVYALDMSPFIFCNRLSWSDDEGETWVTREGACIPGVNDHPSLFAGPATPLTNTAVYPNQLYLCTNQVTDTICYQSPDGGITFTAGQPTHLGYDPDRAEANTTDPPGSVPSGATQGLCGGLAGHGHASWADGTLYLGREWCGEVTVAVSRDGGLTWTKQTISIDPYHAPSEHDVSVGTDQNGTAYAFWIGDEGRSAFLSVSRDQGTTWTTPMNVTAPNVTAAKFPSLVAGAPGRIAFLYVGSENPYGWNIDAMREGCIDPTKEYCYEHGSAYNESTWNAYIGMSLNADSDAPVFATTLANPPDEPLKRGGCEDRCFGDDGGMYDFLDIEMDPTTGQVWAALVDVCSGTCDEPGQGKFTATEKAVGVAGRMIGGVTLLDEPLGSS